MQVAPGSLGKLNCAGQDCSERDGCRRYAIRIVARKVADSHGVERPVHDWASFDVERALLGDCASFVALRR